jgi:hypothetical protein
MYHMLNPVHSSTQTVAVAHVSDEKPEPVGVFFQFLGHLILRRLVPTQHPNLRSVFGKQPLDNNGTYRAGAASNQHGTA